MYGHISNYLIFYPIQIRVPVKRHVAKNKVIFKLADVKQLCHEDLSLVSPELWARDITMLLLTKVEEHSGNLMACWMITKNLFAQVKNPDQNKHLGLSE